jgi:hypothetical protein
MSGIHRGVHARIRERIPKAQYVHSKARVLNLDIVKIHKTSLTAQLALTKPRKS